MSKINLKNPLILAPMAGVTTSTFRRICMRFGASLVVTEMISDKGLIYHNQKTLDMLKIKDDEHPISVQLFGSSAETITEALAIVLKETTPDMIDINMGCPVNKVVKSGAGSSLLENVDKIKDIVSSLKKNTTLPISIKIRAGFDHQHINCDEVASVATLAGVDMITIHGRTRSDLYRGNVNLDYIKMVRDNSTAFVVGNGDIKTADDVRRMLDLGCDAVMIGRSALGNPWIFKKLGAELNGEIYTEPTKEEVISVLLEHAKGLIEESSEKSAMSQMRTHAVWYFKRLPNSKPYRIRLVGINTLQDLEEICNDYLNNQQ